MRQKALLLATLAIALITTSAAQATIRISGDPGGLILKYAQRFLQARASGEKVVIDGHCLSACTLALAMLPREQVCVTSNAVLGFHAAWRPTARGGQATSSVATQAMLDLYPADVRSWIDHNGGLTPRMIFLQGHELTAMVSSCGAGGTRVAGPAQPAEVAGTVGSRYAVARASRTVRPGPAHAKLVSQSTR